MSELKNLKENFVIVIFGPTGVGKSSFAEELAAGIGHAQLVNCDVGQFYSKISIGTAKPDYKNSKIKQHLFDIIDEPEDFNASAYRSLVFDKIQNIWSSGDIPILVGGSGFYLKSLFFPPILPTPILYTQKETSNFSSQGQNTKNQDSIVFEFEKNKLSDQAHKQEQIKFIDIENVEQDKLWPLLYAVDQERAEKISKNDIYRIKRALHLWQKVGVKPSLLEPVFDFPSNFILIFVNRERNFLYKRIEERTSQMIKEGWVDEVKNLIYSQTGDCWENFLKKKKLIGYDLIIDYLKNNKPSSQEALELEIAKRTRNYAKRQVTFWKSLERQLKKEIEKNKYTNKVESVIQEFVLPEDKNKEEKQILDYITYLKVYLKDYL